MNISDAKIVEIVRTVTEWLSSEEGKTKIEHAFRRREQANNKLTEARRVDEKSLLRPVTF